jgi:ferredoxin-nitrate reductase
VVGDDYPLTLTTGRVADHWHTMSRTGKSAKLRASAAEPLLEISPYDALRSGVADGDLAAVASARGEAVFRVAVHEGMQEGLVFAPMHWGALNAPAGAGAVNRLTHDESDPVSRQPELKMSAVRVTRAGGPVARGGRRRLVVVGRGMAGLEVVQEALRRRPATEWEITMLGEEPGPAYNRILLSKLLARTCGAAELELRPASWYEAHGIALAGPAAVLELGSRTVHGADGVAHEYDALVLATGSRPFVPPIAGADQPHVFGFRTRADVDALGARARAGVHAVVVGGGLLGLEAAAGLRARGAHVTVVEFAPLLMPQQLDPGSSELLARSLQSQGIEIRVGRSAASIDAESVTLNDGERLPAELVVIAAGVRAETSLAKAAGLDVARGIVVDAEMRTSAPSVWAVGECAEHAGVVQGLWAPVAEQARVAGASVAGDAAAFHGATPATTLKVAGVELFAGGSARAADGHDEVVFLNTRRKTYRKLVLHGQRLTGAVLVGDASQARALSELLRSGAAVPEELLEPGFVASTSGPADDSAVVCSCNSVTRGEIIRAIRARALTTVIEVGNATRASTGCGSCARDVEAILNERARSSDGNTDGTVAKPAPDTIAA